jgi:hypothetical protein
MMLAAASLILALAGTAGATTSWQTSPILGSGGSNVTGDVVIITGPTPINPSTGLPYRDVDNNIVLGPTIPHYSIVTDPLYQVGSPSMSTFYIDPTTWEGGHWTDKVSQIHSGSGVEGLTIGDKYQVTFMWSFLGTPGNPAYDMPVVSAEFVATETFRMGHSWLYDLWLEDAGAWTFTETWTDNTTNVSMSSTPLNLDVKVIPEPVTMAGMLLGLGALGRYMRRRTA